LRTRHIGIVFDGDKARIVTLDERGEIVDGDKLLGVSEAICTNDLID